MKHPIPGALVAVALFAAATAAQAQVTVKDAWVRATVPQQNATGAFMLLQSATGSRLVSARSPIAPVAEIHEMAVQGDTMRMREVAGVELPAGTTVELKPGGFHVMLMNLTRQVKAGETVPLTLVFEGKDGQRETVEVSAPVRPLTASASGSSGSSGPAHGGHGGHGGHAGSSGHGH